MIRLAINGYGRIGRSVLRALYESQRFDAMRVVAINEPADLLTMAHLTRYDSTHGRFPGVVSESDGCLHINGDTIIASHHRDLNQYDWSHSQVDLVLECSGSFSTRAHAQVLLDNGADPNVKEGSAGQTPLIFAAAKNRVESIKLLLAAGADPSVSTKVVDVLKEAWLS